MARDARHASPNCGGFAEDEAGPDMTAAEPDEVDRSARTIIVLTNSFGGAMRDIAAERIRAALTGELDGAAVSADAVTIATTAVEAMAADFMKQFLIQNPIPKLGDIE